MLLKIRRIYNIIQRNVSALYVTGDKASQNFAVLRPYFDFNSKLNNKQKLEQNINRRELNIDLNELQLLWSTYVDIEKRKSDLENRRQEIVNSIRKLLADGEENEALMRKLKIEGAMARDDLKTLKENSYALEDTFTQKFLSLPNDIHERTPLEEDRVYFSHFDQLCINETENHLSNVDYLEYYDPFCFYLRNDAAKCDLKLPLYCLEMFRSFGFIPFSNPDFVRTILSEGAGINPDELLTIIEEDLDNKLNLLHLAGSGSMLAFLGFVTKWLIFKSCLPLKFVSIGKEFSYSKTKSNESGLYSTCQSTNIQLFGMSGNESEALSQFDETLEQMIEIYKRLDRSFRVTYVTGRKLHQAENFKAVFEMYSPYRKCYVPIGHLSSSGDYISKRLLVALKEDKEKVFQFPYLISGSVIDVTKFVAIVLEEKGVFRTPTILVN